MANKLGAAIEVVAVEAYDIYAKEHTKDPSPSNWDKHTKKRPGAPEKGDTRRPPPLQKPPGHKGPYPPKKVNNFLSDNYNIDNDDTDNGYICEQ